MKEVLCFSYLDNFILYVSQLKLIKFYMIIQLRKSYCLNLYILAYIVLDKGFINEKLVCPKL